MCDTDSVITDAKLNDYPDLMEEFMWDGCGDALGSLKNEADYHLKDCGWANDDIKRLREEEGGMRHFPLSHRRPDTPTTRKCDLSSRHFRHKLPCEFP